MNWILRHGMILTCCGTLALAACAASAGAQQFALKDGDTVVFYGDSITTQRFYTREVEEFVLTRYPKLHVRFVNAGLPGDRVDGGYAGTMAQRVERRLLQRVHARRPAGAPGQRRSAYEGRRAERGAHGRIDMKSLGTGGWPLRVRLDGPRG